MENLTLEQIKRLAQQTHSPSISIFIPTHRAGPDIQQDPIRFKNLLREAELTLGERGMGPREIGELLQPAQGLLDSTEFWQHQRDALAVFIGPDDFHHYHLPFPLDELLVISQSYYTKPLLPLFTNNGHYYILAISQDQIRLFEGTRHSIGQIDLPEGTPESLQEALRFDDPEKQLQFHSGTSQGGSGAAMFHGHGPGDEENKERVERYLNLVDDGLKAIYNQTQAPIVLAGVDYLLPIYQKVSEYANIMPEGITGSPEHLRPEELQEQAWPIVEPYFRQEMETVLAQYQQGASTDKAAYKATDDIEEIVAAAFHGRVDTLIVAIDTQVWGSFDPEAGEVVHFQEEQSQADDLAMLDFAAMQTLQKDGIVYALTQEEMPTDSPIAALLRY